RAGGHETRRAGGNTPSRGRRIATVARVVRRVRWCRHAGGNEESGVRASVSASGADAGGRRDPAASGTHHDRRRARVRGPTERTMNDTTTMTTDLDLLAERVEKA